MIRVAAVGDIHVGEDVRGLYRKRLTGIADDADVLLVAGDLTRHGTAEEGRMAAEELRDIGVPVIAVLGNHDYRLAKVRVPPDADLHSARDQAGAGARSRLW
ncbi:hypothetical protein GCM10023196_044800 [Actinoallomurus vinaceus]|uniref:Calcineurin-like phosphoesterase domain-containing protein n=1 Tax=Actinoallomurus vinaceus TaxID=1080074 RepID=A0ABP8UC30_9ACTN